MDFPEFDGKSDEYADFNNKIGFIVENIQQNNKWLKDVEENWPHRQTLEWFAVSPELDICLSNTSQSGETVSTAIRTALVLLDALHHLCKALLLRTPPVQYDLHQISAVLKNTNWQIQYLLD